LARQQFAKRAELGQRMPYGEPPTVEQRGTRNHICLEVPDMEKAVATLESRKAKAGYTRDIEIKTGVNRKRQQECFLSGLCGSFAPLRDAFLFTFAPYGFPEKTGGGAVDDGAGLPSTVFLAAFSTSRPGGFA
jgi:hypothetical protein